MVDSINVRSIAQKELDRLRDEVNECLMAHVAPFSAQLAGNRMTRTSGYEEIVTSSGQLTGQEAKDWMQTLNYSKRAKASSEYTDSFKDQAFSHLSDIQLEEYNTLHLVIGDMCQYPEHLTCDFTEFTKLVGDLTLAQWVNTAKDLKNFAISYRRMCRVFVEWLDTFNAPPRRPCSDFTWNCWYFRQFKSEKLLARVNELFVNREFEYTTNVNGIYDDVPKAVLSRMFNLFETSYLFGNEVPEVCVGRFLPVPKNCDKDRGVCMQPNASKFESLALDQCLRSALHESYPECVNFVDQSFQQNKCWDLTNYTVDSSDSSDRQHMLLQATLFVNNSNLFELLYDSRPQIIEYNDVAIPVLGLGGMGAPTVFSMQTYLCFVLPHAAKLRYPRLSGMQQVHSSAFGDDIQVSGISLDVLFHFMRGLGMQPNITKSFDNSYFRESCGTWVYHGGKEPTDVTPVFWPRKELRLSTQDELCRTILSLCEHGSNLRRHGYGDAAKIVARFIYSKVDLPNLTDTWSTVKLPADTHMNPWQEVSNWTCLAQVPSAGRVSKKVREEIDAFKAKAKEEGVIKLGDTFKLSQDYLALLGVSGEIRALYRANPLGEYELTILWGVDIAPQQPVRVSPHYTASEISLYNEWMYHNALVRHSEGYRNYHINGEPVDYWLADWERKINQLFQPHEVVTLRQLCKIPSDIHFVRYISEYSFSKKENFCKVNNFRKFHN